MNLQDLEVLVKTGESETVEFKKSTASLRNAAETLCAFLNGRGGIVLLGVSDNKKIIGQSISDHSQQEIANTLRKFEPTANIELKHIDIGNDKRVIALKAHPDSRAVPYIFEGRPYERKESSTSMMTQSKYQQLLLLRTINPVSWESQPAVGVLLEDLDKAEILRTAKDIISRKRLEAHLNCEDPFEILTRLNLIEAGQVTRAAVVLFAKEVPGGYLQCVIRMARFGGIEKSGFLDNKHFFGNAFQLLTEAEAFINRHTAVMSHFTLGMMTRIDEPEYPFEAIREALINALVHRDYGSLGGSVTLTIYDDRLEIASTGILPEGMLLEDLKKPHMSHPRNPRLCNVFLRRGLVEQMGIGTQEIVRACAAEKMREPEFFEQAGAFVVRLWSKHYIETPVTTQLDLSPRHKKIVEIIAAHKKLSSSDIFKHLNEGISDRTLRSDLNYLRKNKWLEREGKGPNTRWYCIK
jgi:ATP-dependent DNA helicase RecG